MAFRLVVSNPADAWGELNCRRRINKLNQTATVAYAHSQAVAVFPFPTVGQEPVTDRLRTEVQELLNSRLPAEMASFHQHPSCLALIAQATATNAAGLRFVVVCSPAGPATRRASAGRAARRHGRWFVDRCCRSWKKSNYRPNGYNVPSRAC